MVQISSEHNKQMERETQEHNKKGTIKKMERGRWSKQRRDRHDMKAAGFDKKNMWTRRVGRIQNDENECVVGKGDARDQHHDGDLIDYNKR